MSLSILLITETRGSYAMSGQSVYAVIGRDTPRKDGISKVTGQERFSSDLTLPGMLHARIVKSPHPHANVIQIDKAEAEKVGAYVLTPDDVPDVRFCPRLVSTPEATYKDWHILARKPVYVGEPIAVVAAETEEQAQTALELLKVEYEPLPADIDSFESMKLGTMLHDGIILKETILGSRATSHVPLTTKRVT